MEIPARLRPAIREQLDALATGERPALLTWVESYRASGAVLIRQPEEIWAHSDSEIEFRDDCTAWGVVPLWTEDESPSDLSAEFEVDSDGRVTIYDVRAL